MKFVLKLLIPLLITLFAYETQSVQPEVHQFASEFIKPLSWSQIDASLPGKTNAWAKSFLLGPLGQTVSGVSQISANSLCSPQKIELRLQSISTFPQWHHRLEEVLQKCQAEMTLGTSSSILNSLKTVNLRMDLEEHPFLTPVEINISGQQNVRAWLGWHGDFKPRPMLIIRGGIFSSTSEFLAERYLWMQFFEQGPFNVLMIENSSGPDFIYNNSKVAVGGFFEAQQNLWIAKKLKSSAEPISKIISSVHLMGISLGGQGVLMAHQWNDLNDAPIESFMAYCPVVSMKRTSVALMSQGAFSVAADFWIAKRLQWLGKSEENLSGYPWSSLFELAPNFQKKLWKFTESHFDLDLLTSLKVKIPKTYLVDSNYWNANEYNFKVEPSQKELLILATAQDHLVPFSLNSKKFENLHENIQVSLLSEGMHCSFPSNYDWNAMTSVAHSYWNRNPLLRNHWKVNSMEIPLGTEKEILFQARDVSSIKWNPVFSDSDSDKKFVKIKLQVELKSGKKVELNELNWALSELDFKFSGAPWTRAEKEMITRWMNQNLNMDIRGTPSTTVLNVSWKVWE